MSKKDALIPIEERQVDFYGDTITGALVELEDERELRVYVPVRPLCDYMGVNWSGQRQRIMRDPVLSKLVETVRIERGATGGNPNVMCLPLDYLNGWLFGINASRVREEIRSKVIQYQEYCYRVLFEAFHVVKPREVNLTDQQAALLQIHEIGRAIMRLAEEQMQLEGRVSDVEELAKGAHNRLDTAAEVISNLMRRQDYLEARIAPGKSITEEQAAEVSGAVKALAQLLTEQDPSQNQYQGIFAELYRRFGVSSYKNIPATKFKEVMEFLEDWRQSVAGGSDEEE